MRDVIARALARRKELLSELREVDQFLKIARRLEAPVDQDASISAELENVGTSWKEAPRSTDLIDATERILRSVGRPLTRGTLFQIMKDAGVRMPGKDPVRNFGTVLWRSGKFDNTGRTYWFKDQQRPRGE